MEPLHGVDYTFHTRLLSYTTQYGFVAPFPALRLFDTHSSDSCGRLIYVSLAVRGSVCSLSALPSIFNPPRVRTQNNIFWVTDRESVVV